MSEVIEKYNLYEDCDPKKNECNTETTTIIEDDDLMFMHPPRMLSLRILQIAPFPEYCRPETYWKTRLEIPKKSWGEWENTKFNQTYTLDSINYETDLFPRHTFLVLSQNLNLVIIQTCLHSMLIPDPQV